MKYLAKELHCFNMAWRSKLTRPRQLSGNSPHILRALSSNKTNTPGIESCLLAFDDEIEVKAALVLPK
jgi:hypothetical protein